MDDPMYPVALQFVCQVRTDLTGDDHHIYRQFIHTLKQLLRPHVDPSVVVSTVERLFQNHPHLLHGFKSFLPAPENPDVRAAVDFINRVRTRFGVGRVYNDFLHCMQAFSREEISAAEACDEVVRLYGGDDDLAAEFMSFAPESARSKKRETVDDDEECWMQQKRKRSRNSRVGEEGKKKMADRENENEDSLCEIDRRLGCLESVRGKAESIADRLRGGRMTPGEFRLVVEEELAQPSLGFMRKLDRKIEGQIMDDPLHGLEKLKEMLTKKKASMEKERLKIIQKWKNLRSSSDYRAYT